MAPGPRRTVIVRIAIALGLAMLLLLGAWTDSHGETATAGSICVADGVSAGAVAHDHGASVVDAAASDGLGAIGVCALLVFLLVLLTLRMLRMRIPLRLSSVITASAPPRAGPIAPVIGFSLVQLSVSRT